LQNYRKFIVPLVVVLVLGGIVALKRASGDAAKDTRRTSAPLVRTEQPVRQLVRYQLTCTGDVDAFQQATIYARINGALEKVSVNLGSVVRKGQVLALIDSVEPYDQVQQMAATYQNAALSYERSKSLLGSNLISKQDVDNADAALKVARANYELAKTRLGYTKIIAPFPGIITKRYLDPGTYLASSSTPLFQLMFIDSVKVLINVQERDLVSVKPGTKAEITVDTYGNRIFPGAVTRMADALDLSTRSMAVEIDIPNYDHILKPGMFATVNLIIGDHQNAITVPTMALQKDDSGSFVYVADNDVARQKRIILGIEQGSRTEIISGLEGSEPVIVVGQQLVKNGGFINVQK
jgi:membrane fusion protein, multidrug efflux system